MINFPFSRRSAPVLLMTIAAALLIMTAARPMAAPTFKVEKFDIKGDGGTDYVTVEAAHRARVRVARRRT